MKKTPAFRKLERKRLSIERSRATGKCSGRLARELKSILRSRRRRLLNRELYLLVKAAA